MVFEINSKPLLIKFSLRNNPAKKFAPFHTMKLLFTPALAFCIFLSATAQAQNLVPNPGFEDFTTCPVGFSSFDGFVSEWVNPSQASPDYMNACANPFPAGVPQNGVGYQQSHGGEGYAGSYYFSGDFYTEYIQVQLTAPLVAGNEYLFNMYVVLHNKSEMATDDIGAYFSVTAPASSGSGFLVGNPVPQITNTAGNVITDTLNWQLISGTYIASGGESFLTIGHFRPDSLVTFVSLPYGNLGPYYYIDDVSLESQSGGNFIASDTNVCEKFCVDFFDQSTNNPTSWQWFFPGGTPSSSTDQNPIQVCYQTPGTYDVTLITTNSGGNDTLTLPGYVTVNPTPATPTITQSGLTLTSSPASAYQWQLNAMDIAGATNPSYTVTQSGLYSVVIFDGNGCQNAANLFVSITGIEGIFGDASISIFPNPSNGVFVIELTSNTELSDLMLYLENELGQRVYYSMDVPQAKTLKKEINIGALPSGIYFLRLQSGNSVMIKRVEIF
jgi:PKD repeat protein